jgi:excisionase family DNA binding protein
MGRRSSPNLVTFTERRDQAAINAAALFDETRLTVQQAATEAGVSEHTIRRAYAGGHLVVKRFGLGARAIRIRRGDLRAWIEGGGQTLLPAGKVR